MTRMRGGEAEVQQLTSEEWLALALELHKGGPFDEEPTQPVVGELPNGIWRDHAGSSPTDIPIERMSWKEYSVG